MCVNNLIGYGISQNPPDDNDDKRCPCSGGRVQKFIQSRKFCAVKIDECVYNKKRYCDEEEGVVVKGGTYVSVEECV